MSQAGLLTSGQQHDSYRQVVNPDGGAKFVFDNCYGQVASVTIGQPVGMARAAIVRRADSQAGAQDERPLAFQYEIFCFDACSAVDAYGAGGGFLAVAAVAAEHMV